MLPIFVHSCSTNQSSKETIYNCGGYVYDSNFNWSVMCKMNVFLVSRIVTVSERLPICYVCMHTYVRLHVHIMYPGSYGTIVYACVHVQRWPLGHCTTVSRLIRRPRTTARSADITFISSVSRLFTRLQKQFLRIPRKTAQMPVTLECVWSVCLHFWFRIVYCPYVYAVWMS